MPFGIEWGLNFEHYKVIPATVGYNNPQVQISWSSSLSQSRMTIAQYCKFRNFREGFIFRETAKFREN